VQAFGQRAVAAGDNTRAALEFSGKLPMNPPRRTRVVTSAMAVFRRGFLRRQVAQGAGPPRCACAVRINERCSFCAYCEVATDRTGTDRAGLVLPATPPAAPPRLHSLVGGRPMLNPSTRRRCLDYWSLFSGLLVLWLFLRWLAA